MPQKTYIVKKIQSSIIIKEMAGGVCLTPDYRCQKAMACKVMQVSWIDTEMLVLYLI